MIKTVYLGLSILELGKTSIYEFCYDHVKLKYGEKVKYHAYSFIVSLKIDHPCKGIAEHVETRFDTSNYELDRSLSKEKYEKVIELINNELRGNS